MTSAIGLIGLLPNELLQQLFEALDIQSIVALSSSHSHLKRFVHDNQCLWRTLCTRYGIAGCPPGTSDWQSHFKMNYPKCKYVQQWLDGKFTYISSSNAPQIADCKMFELDADTWGRILDVELSRS